MSNLTVDEILDILNQEIEWCNTHGDKPFLTVQQEWFVNGLEQAKLLILSADITKTLGDE